jgi:hypothetical protein
MECQKANDKNHPLLWKGDFIHSKLSRVRRQDRFTAPVVSVFLKTLFNFSSNQFSYQSLNRIHELVMG